MPKSKLEIPTGRFKPNRPEGQEKPVKSEKPVTQSKGPAGVAGSPVHKSFASSKKPGGHYLRLDLVPGGSDMVQGEDFRPYLRAMSGLTGKSVSGYIQDLIRKDMEENKERYAAVMQLMDNK